MPNQHANKFEPACCNRSRRMVLPGGIIICVYCDREGARTIIPNMNKSYPVPPELRTWEVPRA